MKKKKNTKLYEWQSNRDKGICECGETRHLTVDHIVPVSLLEQFNLDKPTVLYEMEENFRYLCRYCNSNKSSKIDVRDPKTYLILRKVLEDAERYFIKKEDWAEYPLPVLDTYEMTISSAKYK